MNKKISLGLCLSLVIVAIAATFAGTMISSKQIYNKIISNISQRSQTYDSVDEISKIVSNYFYGKTDDYNSLNSSLAEGYVNGLGDANSKYLTADEYKSYTEKIESGLTGMGIETAYNYSGNQFTVTYVYPGSPAEKSGLKTGDAILSVNDIDVNSSNYSILSDTFYGSKLSTVKIKYQRNDETKSCEPMLGFTIPSVISKTEGNVGYIKINGFYKNTADDIKSLVDDYENQGVDGIVFDVRNTKEGTIEYATKAIDVLASAVQGNLAEAVDKTGGKYELYSSNSERTKLSMAVLINSGTTGPAELFACDLRDISDATLVGTTSAGVGTLQELFTLEDGGAVLLTVAKIIPAGGENSVYDGTGVTPDKSVALKWDDSNLSLISSADDNQLQTAISLFTQQ